MKNNKINPIFPLALALSLVTGQAFAQNPNYTAGDLVLYFQKEGGTNTVYANLGNAATVFRGSAAGPGAPDKINFLTIKTTLDSAFGTGWASDPTVYAGLAAVYSPNNTSSTVVDGDPYRTLYVSAARAAVGSVGVANSAGYTVNTNTGMTAGSNGVNAQNLVFETAYLNAVVVSPTATSRIDDYNPFVQPGLQDTAFDIFGGGVQQAGSAGTFGSLGAAGSVEFALDLYRILAKTGLGGQVAGNLRQGSFEGTVTVNSGGMISFISQGAPGSAFDTWIGTFPALDTPAKKLKTADPENDGLTNLMEFVLNGNPSISDTSIAPVLDASGSNFVFSFNRRDDSETGNTLIFQYGTSLTGWTSTTIGAVGGPFADGTIGITENTTNPDAITVTIPKTFAPGGQLFGRLKVTNP